MSRLICYRPTPEDVAEAFRRAEQQGVLPNSLTQGRGRMTGFLGEIAFEKTFTDGVYVGDQSYTHDYEFENLTVDIKSKACNSAPRSTYNASVLTPRNKPLASDIYFFTRVKSDFTRVWLCGWVTANTIEKPKWFKKKGETDNAGFTFFGDGYHMPIKATRRPDSFLRQCRSLAKG